MTEIIPLASTNKGYALGIIDQDKRLAPTTKRKYRAALEGFFNSGRDVRAYSANLTNSNRSHFKAAMRKLSEAISDETILTAPRTAEATLAIQRMQMETDVILKQIRVKSKKGNQTHFWLTGAEVRGLLGQYDLDDLQGLQRRVILAVLVGAGLRRNEAANLEWSQIEQLPGRVVFNITGKGAKSRTVPISDKLAELLERWAARVGRSGRVLRAIGMEQRPSDSISTAAIFNIVRAAGAGISKPKLAPHDLRRTYAQLGVNAGVPIQQISVLLGHASIKTTQRYLNLAVDLDQTVSDFVPIG